MRFLLRRLLDLVLVLVLTAAAVTASAVWFALHPVPQPAETIIVLGGAMTGDNALASETIGRVETGVAIYEAGLAPSSALHRRQPRQRPARSRRADA